MVDMRKQTPRGEIVDAGVLKTPVQVGVLVQLQSGGPNER